MTNGGSPSIDPLSEDAAFRAVFDVAAVPAFLVDEGARFHKVNAAFANLLGRPPVALTALSLSDVTRAQDVPAALDMLVRVRSGGVLHARAEMRLLLSDGSAAFVAVHAVPLPVDTGRRLILCQVIDITEQRHVEAVLAQQATIDPLTSLSTRLVFVDHVARALARLPRRNGRLAAVLFLDLDRLKYVNDTFGHTTGDALLTEFAARLRGAVRPSDVVARLGGDEFAVLLEEVEHPEESAAVARRIIDGLASPFDHAGRQLEIRASIGIAVSATNKTTPGDLIAHADAAMYRAKQRGTGGYEVFNEDAYTAALRRQRDQEDVRAAAENGELLLHYQPMLDLNTGRITAVEALLRWDHLERGIVAATEFIDVAEDADLLRPLSPWLFRTACAQLAAWDAQLGAIAPQQIFVNIAGSQLADPGLVPAISEAARASALDIGRVNVEITEAQILADPAATEAAARRIRELGAALVVDDFGTSSSLSRLTSLPVSALKLDRSLVTGLTTSRRTAAIAASVALLAHNLGYTVIAEGVETEAELLAVSELGCELAQGYLISPALPHSEVTTLIKSGCVRTLAR